MNKTEILAKVAIKNHAPATEKMIEEANSLLLPGRLVKELTLLWEEFPKIHSTDLDTVVAVVKDARQLVFATVADCLDMRQLMKDIADTSPAPAIRTLGTLTFALSAQLRDLSVIWEVLRNIEKEVTKLSKVEVLNDDIEANTKDSEDDGETDGEV